MKIKLRQLNHALALCRHGNFRRAAADQHLTQPALSRSIHALEMTLGVMLFDRDAGEVTVTSYGEALLRRAENITTAAAELEREIGLMRGLDVGRLSVAMGVYSAGMSGTRAIARLLQDHPRLHVSLEMRHWRDVERMVRSRQVDIGFGEVAHLADSPDLSVEVVGRHELVFFCRAGHPLLARKTAISPADLDEYPFAGVPIPFRMAPLFPRNCIVDEKTADILPPILVEDLDATCTIVANTDAFGVSTPLKVEPWLKSGALALIPLRAPWARVQYGFISLLSRSLPPAAEAFKDLVREVEREVSNRNTLLTDELFQGQQLFVSCPPPSTGTPLPMTGVAGPNAQTAEWRQAIDWSDSVACSPRR